MIPGSLAKRYARALMMMAETPMQRETFGRGLNAFNDALKVGDGTESGATLGSILESQRYLMSERRGIIESVCRRLGVDSNVMAFLVYVLGRDRIAGVDQMTRFYNDMADELAGRIHAIITSARRLTPDASHKLKTALETSTGKTVVVDSVVDPELIGGVVAQVGSLVVDGSVKAQLESIRSTLSG